MDISGYSIQKKIGKGGMATVYLATQESLGRPVVLKILDISKQTDNQSMIERFMGEGRIVASLNHPNIITIYDIGVADDNSLYISMEYIQGGDLKARIGIPFDPDEALELLAKVGSGLQVAHEHGIIHRDIKPANILFRDTSTPLITDFGIAKKINEDLNLTSTGIFIGSPNYVSPEQADGIEVDTRTDIYSLGCIFYEMMTGDKPYPADTVFDVVMQHKQSPIPELPEDFHDLQPLLNNMMAKKKQDRFEDAKSMIHFIEHLSGRRRPFGGMLDFDITTGGEISGNRKKRKYIIYLVLLLLSASFFFSLQFVEIRIKKNESRLGAVPVVSTLLPSDQITGTSLDEDGGIQTYSTSEIQTNSDEVINALKWLGKQSLEEYRLTYPPKDNAYYYFSRLLEIEPSDVTAKQGILSIADRYSVLAERALVDNEYKKAEAYINIGLKINPQNQSLLSLQTLSEEIRRPSLLEAIKNIF